MIGPAGPTGATGPAGADSTVPGPAGPTGATGPAGPSIFSAITSATNTTAAMVVGTGASLSTSGSGTIIATGLTPAAEAALPVSAAQAAADAVVASNASAALLSHTTDTGNPHAVTKAQVGLSNADNTSDINKPVSTAQAAADTAIYVASQAYADGLVVGLLDDRGNYDASTNLYPATGGSGTAGAILKGDLWRISVAGTLGGVAVTPGDQIRALVDTPAQTAGNWAVTEANLGFVPENSANKDASGGYAGLTGFAIRLKDAAGTITSLLTSVATAARTWTLPDKDGTVVLEGLATDSGLTVAAPSLLGSTSGASAIQEVNAGSNLELTSVTLGPSTTYLLNAFASGSVVGAGEVQFRDIQGRFEGVAGFRYNSGTNVLTVGAITGNAATVTTNANLTGPITSVGNATAIALQTGTGSTLVVQTSPTLVTPNIGDASGTSLTLNNASAGAETVAIQLLPGTSGGLPAYGFGIGPTSSVGMVTYRSGTSSSSAFGHRFLVNNVEVLRINGDERVSVGGIVVPTALLHLKAGTAAAGTAPIKLTPGTLLTTLEQGAIEYTDNGTTGALYMTMNAAGVLVRRQIL